MLSLVASSSAPREVTLVAILLMTLINAAQAFNVSNFRIHRTDLSAKPLRSKHGNRLDHRRDLDLTTQDQSAWFVEFQIGSRESQFHSRSVATFS